MSAWWTCRDCETELTKCCGVYRPLCLIEENTVDVGGVEVAVFRCVRGGCS